MKILNRTILCRRIVVLAVLLFCMVGIVAADDYIGGAPPETVITGTVSGGVYMDATNTWWPSSPGPQDVTKTFASIPNVGSSIKWARLYVSVYCGHMQNNYRGTATVSFDGNGDGTYETPLGTENLNVAYVNEYDGGTTPVVVNDHTNRVTSDYLMWYDVTSLISSQTPKAHVITTNVDSDFDGRVKMITLVVAYDDGDSDTVKYWVNQGHDVDSYYSDDNLGEDYIGETSFDLSGISGTIETATLTVNHLASQDGTYTFQGNSIPSDPSTGNYQGAFFGYNIWDVKSIVQSGSSNKLTYDRTGQFYKIPLTTLAVKVDAVTACDLTPTLVNPDTGNVFANEPNRVRVNVKNNGPQASPATDVRLTSNDGADIRESVPEIASGQTTAVYVTDSTIRTSQGGSVTYTATVDPDNSVPETNEGNNAKDSTVKTVKFNGYKGKRYWTGGNDISTKRTFDLRGGILYSSGDSVYKSGGIGGSGWSSYDATWTSGDLPLPAGATVEETWLYVPYTWDDTSQIPDHFDIIFNGEVMTPQHLYEDRSNFGGYANHDYGLLTYDVTSLYDPSGNSAHLSKDDVNTNVAMYGLTLAVIYRDATATRKQIFLNEEFDILGADTTNYATTPEEATAYVPFSGMAIVPGDVSQANLITFVPAGNGPEGDLLFNGDAIATNVWDYGSLSGTQVAVDTRNVKAYLQASNNEAGIRSTAGSTPLMAASHAFLVVEYSEAAPVAAFSATPLTGNAPHSVQFTDESTGFISSYAWDFDNDGDTDSTLQNPSYEYPVAGTYTVTLTVTGPGGSDDEVKTGYISVTSAAVPVAQFIASTSNGPAPLSVTFTDQSTNSPTAWKWEYKNYNGDWTQFSTAQNPTYSFATAGTYDIRLTATNTGGSGVETKTHFVAVSGGRDSLKTVGSGTVTGDLSVESYGLWPATESTKSFILPAAAVSNIQRARLYVNTYGGSAAYGYGHQSTVEFDGNGDGDYLDTGEILGVEICDIGSETNGNSYPLNDHITKVFSDYEAEYDVTSMISATNPSAHIKSEAIAGKTFDGRQKTITLVVAYNDPSSTTETRYWVNHGQDWFDSSYGGDTGSTTFSTSSLGAGFDSATGTDLCTSSTEGTYTFNGISQSTVVPNPTYFAFHTWDLKDEITAGTDSTLVFGRGSGAPSFKTTLATLAVRYETEEPAPDIDFSADKTSPVIGQTVTFTATNNGGQVNSWAWTIEGAENTDYQYVDSTSSASQNPKVKFLTEDTFDVSLTATGPDYTDTETKSNYIQVGAAVIDVSVSQASIDFGTMQAGVDETGSTNVNVDVTGGTAWSVTASASNGGYMSTGSVNLASPFQLSNGGTFKDMTGNFADFLTGSAGSGGSGSANVKQAIASGDTPGAYSITVTFTGGFI